jgi:transposase-like protein
MVCPTKDADQSGASAAAILSVNEDSGADIELRQRKYLDNIVEQDHRAIKRGAADAWFQVLPLCTHPSCRSSRSRT